MRRGCPNLNDKLSTKDSTIQACKIEKKYVQFHHATTSTDATRMGDNIYYIVFNKIVFDLFTRNIITIREHLHISAKLKLKCWNIFTKSYHKLLVKITIKCWPKKAGITKQSATNKN